jgi:dephospho-CoA kinase
MKTFNTLKKYLEEKLVVVGGGKRTGQVIFLAGGAGSGKGFAINNFIQSNNFKVFDPDALKQSILKWNEASKRYPELLGRSMKNPNDVSVIHTFIRDRLKWDKKLLHNFLSVNRPDKENLPNIIFDKTLKDTEEFKELIPELLKVGYKKEDMHLVWVLTNYRVAIQANTSRDRTVPVTVLIQTHSGVAETMKHFLFKNYPSDLINGDAFVILGGEENTVFFKPSPDETKTRKVVADMQPTPKPRVVKEFQYIKVKDARLPFKPSTAITNTILMWILKNSPDQETIQQYLNAQSAL